MVFMKEFYEKVDFEKKISRRWAIYLKSDIKVTVAIGEPDLGPNCLQRLSADDTRYTLQT